MGLTKDPQVVSKLLVVFNRLYTYRGHWSMESLLSLTQKKLMEETGVSVTIEEIRDVLKENPQVTSYKFKKPVLVKRDTTVGQWCDNTVSTDRKRVYQQPSEDNFAKIHPRNTSSPIKSLNFERKNFDLSFETESSQSNRRFSKIPRPVSTLSSRSRQSSQSKQESSCFERLYENRPRPCPHKVEAVRYIKEVFTAKPASKRMSEKMQPCIYHEPARKKSRYSKECLGGNLNSCVYERLYAQRKQYNTKKLTDVQKREAYMKKQREQLKNHKNSKASLCFTPHSVTESLNSHVTSERATESDCDNSDVTETTLESDNNQNMILKEGNTTLKSDKPVLIEEDIKDSAKFSTIQDLLEGMTVRFNEQMSLCTIDENEM